VKLRHTLLAALLVVSLAGGLAAQKKDDKKKEQQQQQQQGFPTAEQQQQLRAIENSRNPQQTVTLVEQFLEKYPDTPATWGLCRRASDAYRQLGNYAKAIEFGERAIELNQYVEKLFRAEKYARQALEKLPQFFETMQTPPGMGPEEVVRQKKLVEAQPHATLGYIHLLRNEHAKAEDELEQATDLSSSQPNAMDFLRLGRAYYFQEKFEDAVAAFRKAVAMGGALYDTAQRHLQAAEQALERQKQAPKPDNQ
jgi:tetratricopeptide (TPR) repeat protein